MNSSEQEGGSRGGPSSLLDRLKDYLPLMAKANEELKARGGDAGVIDADLRADKDDCEEQGGECDNGDHEEEKETGNMPADGTRKEKKDERVVQMSFAIGDVSDTVGDSLEEEEEDCNEEQGKGDILLPKVRVRCESISSSNDDAEEDEHPPLGNGEQNKSKRRLIEEVH